MLPTPSIYRDTAGPSYTAAEWIDSPEVDEVGKDNGATRDLERSLTTADTSTSLTPASGLSRSTRSDETTQSPDLSNLLSQTSAAALAEEDGTRRRRPRSSVNYKEPSLTK